MLRGGPSSIEDQISGAVREGALLHGAYLFFDVQFISILSESPKSKSVSRFEQVSIAF
jgi:hypothetical protein